MYNKTLDTLAYNYVHFLKNVIVYFYISKKRITLYYLYVKKKTIWFYKTISTLLIPFYFYLLKKIKRLINLLKHQTNLALGEIARPLKFIRMDLLDVYERFKVEVCDIIYEARSDITHCYIILKKKTILVFRHYIMITKSLKILGTHCIKNVKLKKGFFF